MFSAIGDTFCGVAAHILHILISVNASVTFVNDMYIKLL